MNSFSKKVTEMFGKKKPISGIYITATPSKPLGGISKEKPQGPCVCVLGVTLEYAASKYPGLSIPWHVIPFAEMQSIENGSAGYTKEQFEKLVGI